MKTGIFPEICKGLLSSLVMVGMLSSCIHKKYETPITKDTQQPDKVLFDKAMHDIERGRYETARIELNTLMNTYESSEYLAKAKLALADSWFREGGPNGMAQAEAEYKDFELFYPTMEESAEAQYKICMIHYKEMDKADRDPGQALRAEDECRNLLVQYPNSKHAPQASQLLRNIQEVLGEHEYRVGDFYYRKGANPAAANRMSYVADQYPLYSGTDEALWEAGKAYLSMGPKFRQHAADSFGRIIRDYPLSDRVDQAKSQLEDMEVPIPQGSRAAYDRQKYDLENYHRRSMVGQTTGFLFRGPDVSRASKMGAPAMQNITFPIPASVPKANNTTETANNGAPGEGTTDIQAGVIQDGGKLEQGNDARQAATPATPPPPASEAMPTNHDAEIKKARERAEKKAKKSKKKVDTTVSTAPAAGAPANGTAPTNVTPANAQQPTQVQAQPQNR